MSSVIVNVIVEGQTERAFVRDVLAPTLSAKEIYLCPTLIGKSGQIKGGGDVRFERALTDIGQFLKQPNNTFVTTMFDYFRIDPAWPGQDEVQKKIKTGAKLTPTQKAQILETATCNKVIQTYPNANAQKRFIPYLAMHEYEAMLFSDADILSQQTGINLSTIQEILKKHGEPEAINDDLNLAPSKQILTHSPSYLKVVMGRAIAEAIGIPTLRQKCSHFAQWLSKLENLKNG